MSLKHLCLRGILAWQRADILPSGIRGRLLRLVGCQIARDVVVAGGVRITGAYLTMEAGAFVNSGTILDASAPLRIGAGVHVAPGAMILTGSHAIGHSSLRAGIAQASSVDVGDGSWIGAGAIILPGVSIAPGCVVGAGAVVTRDTESDGLYVGNPARRHRNLPSGG